MHQTLTLRSDRVIALFRLTLAAVLLGTFWLDPHDPISSSFAYDPQLCCAKGV